MNITHTILDNDLDLVLGSVDNTPTTTVMVMVNAGTRFETPENNGISHFLEHMFFKGTKNRPSSQKVAIALDSLGAESNAFTWYDRTAYFGKVQADKTTAIIDVLADIYQNSLFPEEEIEKEAGVIREEIRKYNDNPSINVHYAFHEQVYGDHPMGRHVLGTEDTVSSFQQSDLIKYRENHYSPSNTVVVAVGNIDEDEIAQQISNRFSDMKATSTPEADPVSSSNSDTQVTFRQKDSEQTHLIVGAKTISRTNERRPALDVLSTLIGKGQSSRLYNKMREEMGVCYSVGTDVEYYTDTGLFKMVAGVDTARVSESIEAMIGVLNSVTADSVSDKEFAKAKQHRVGNYLLDHETTDEVAQHLASQMMFEESTESPQDYAEKLRNVSKEDVIKEAQELLDKDLQTAIIGPKCDKQKITDILNQT